MRCPANHVDSDSVVGRQNIEINLLMSCFLLLYVTITAQLTNLFIKCLLLCKNWTTCLLKMEVKMSMLDPTDININDKATMMKV